MNRIKNILIGIFNIFFYSLIIEIYNLKKKKYF